MTRDVAEAQAELDELIEEVLKGTEVIITVDAKPVAKMVPVQQTNQPLSQNPTTK